MQAMHAVPTDGYGGGGGGGLTEMRRVSPVATTTTATVAATTTSSAGNQPTKQTIMPSTTATATTATASRQPPKVQFPKPPPGFMMPPMTMTIPPSQPSSLGTTTTAASSIYHPEFMFCGSCTDCQEEDIIKHRSNRDNGDIDDYDDDENDYNSGYDDSNDDGAAGMSFASTNSSSEDFYGGLSTDESSFDDEEDDEDHVTGAAASPLHLLPLRGKRREHQHQHRRKKQQNQQTTLQLRHPISIANLSTTTTTINGNSSKSKNNAGTNRSAALIIKSVLKPLPGVHNVAILSHDKSKGKKKKQQQKQQNDTESSHNGNNTTIVIDHDASAHTQQFLTVLESAGHPAIVIMNGDEALSLSNHYRSNHDSNSNNQTGDGGGTDESTEVWVRSQFYVQGVCCASELPALKKIVHRRNLGPGVGRLNVNLTTKVVHVQHNVKLLGAQQIAKELTRQGFPTQVQKDGKTMAVLSKNSTNQSSTIGRSTFHVQGGLTNPRDASTIQSILANINGINKVGVNVEEGIVYVDHDTTVVPSTVIAETLSNGESSSNSILTTKSEDEDDKATIDGTNTRRRFVCSVAVAAERSAGDAAAAALDQIGRSRYVESTIRLEGIQGYQVPLIENVLKKNFIRVQLRAIYPSVMSETIKVEHDPKMASIEDICNVLNDPLHNASYSSALTATVAIDGADANLYLPLQDDYGENEVKYEKEPSLMTIHANVWLSGVFWLLSLVGYSEGREWFKYFGLLSVVFGIPPIALKAWRTLKRRQFDANCMMVTASIGALALGEFDEAASVAFLFAISEFLEARATMKARKALSEICALRPDHANVIHPITKEIVVVPAERVPLGSMVSVRTGDKIVADGVIVEGTSSIDESSLTGESTPAHKKIGDSVSGGTINIGQTQLVVKTTTTVDDSAVSRLIRLVEEAQSNRSPTEKMIDVFARSYTPGVMFMAVLMCTVPWIFGSDIGRYWTLNGLIVIVIACPCALTISTPVTYAAGLAAAAQQGIIIKGGNKLEAMGSVDRVVFDKTGTLTKGTFAVTHLEVVGKARTRTEMLEMLSLMQERASHPVALSLVQAAKDEGISLPRNVAVTEHQILKGEGITAKVDGQTVYVGNERLFNRLNMLQSLAAEDLDLSKEFLETGGSVGFIGTAVDGIIGIFCVKDVVREEARAVIQDFRESHVDTLICTGDSHSAAQAVAEEIGIPSTGVHSQLLPEDKLHFVGSLKRLQPKTCGLFREKRYVLFCGDGVNDAPALAVADIGVSMGEGAAMALEMSDVTLMDSRLTKLSFAINLGRRVLRTVKENIIISLLAKIIVVVLTFLGHMTLLYAIAADVGIMLAVTLNGMKLLPSASLVNATRLRRRSGNSSFVAAIKKGKRGAFELVGSSEAMKHNYDDGEHDPNDRILASADIV